MEIREYAFQIILGESLSEKLSPKPSELTDREPGSPLKIESPARSDQLQIFDPRVESGPSRNKKLPRPSNLNNEMKRAVAIHYFANHELMAIEMMAWALLAFPETPTDFRLSTIKVLNDEQRHLKLYLSRLKDFNVEFGSLPLNDYFWKHIPQVNTPIEFLSVLALTFEGANLDFSLEYRDAFLRAGDVESAQIMDEIHEDEITHVRHGVYWINKWKNPELSDWEVYVDSLHFPISPQRAIGKKFYKNTRIKAGISEEFIQNLQEFEY